ncbi:MAG: HlyD family secretion protein [Bryobacteraceae bacterium]
MSTAFTRTLRSLRVDRFRFSVLGIFLAACFLGAWTAWALYAQVTLYEVTEKARLEVDDAISPIQAPILGRVVTTNLAMGREVKTGDILVEIDAAPQQLQIQEERTRLVGLTSDAQALRSQVLAEEQARAQESHASKVAMEEARAKGREAEAPARYAEDDAKRVEKLRDDGLIAEREFLRSRAEAQKTRAAADGTSITVEKLDQEQRTRERDRTARIQRLEGEITKITGQLSTIRATIGRLDYEIERRRIRAPMDGRLGEAAILRVGAVVQEGEKLGAIVPAGRLLLVAQFPPPAALGRVQNGQRARARLHGFPWTQYGSLTATVTRVAGEVRDGTVRVELAVDPEQKSSIPMQHGLPGAVEVEVESVTPAVLVMRAAGRWLASPRSAFAANP